MCELRSAAARRLLPDGDDPRPGQEQRDRAGVRRYRLVELLGRGGMGEVWRAVDTEKDREVALKVLGSWLNGDPQFAERFRRESALAARLNSPHIVPIHDYGGIDGRLYIDMPLIDGTDLATLLESGPVPPARAVRIVEQVARALDTAHRAGLVHRDVKPSNILVCTGNDDHAYLIDFGIAKALDGTRLSLSGAVVGTAAYMAPECFTGNGDTRSDLYSLGCVLYEALTGQPPFTAPHFVAYAVVHQNEPSPRPSARRSDVPPALDAVIARALAKAPDERFSSTTELATEARDALGPTVAAESPARLGALTVVPEPDRLEHADTRSDEQSTTVVPITSPNVHNAATSFDDGPATRPGLAATAQKLVNRRRHRWWVIAALPAVLVLVAIGVVALRTSGSPAPGPTPEPVRTLIGDVATGPLATTKLDGKPVAITGGRGGDSFLIWDLTTGHQIGQLSDAGGPGWVGTTQLDGRPAAVAGSGDGSVRIWDLTSGRQIRRFATSHGLQSMATAEIDGQPVAITGSQDGAARIWDLTTGQQIGQPLIGNDSYVNAVATTQLNGRTVAITGGADSTVRVWNLATDQQIGQPLASHTSPVVDLATSEVNDHPVAVTGNDDSTVRIWDLATGRQIGQPLIGHTRTVWAVATTLLEGRPVAVTGSYDNTVRIWDLTTGQELGQPLTGHTAAVTLAATAEVDGRPVAITSDLGGTVRTWDLLAAIGK